MKRILLQTLIILFLSSICLGQNDNSYSEFEGKLEQLRMSEGKLRLEDLQSAIKIGTLRTCWIPPYSDILGNHLNAFMNNINEF